MIQYTYPWPEYPTIRVPKLHRVNYDPKYNWGEIHRWCQECCLAAFYISMEWQGKFVEFENDQDATAFALRWS